MSSAGNILVGNHLAFVREALKTTSEVSGYLYSLSKAHDPILVSVVEQKLTKLRIGVSNHIPARGRFTVFNLTPLPDAPTYSFCLGRLFNLAMDLRTAQVLQYSFITISSVQKHYIFSYIRSGSSRNSRLRWRARFCRTST